MDSVSNLADEAFLSQRNFRSEAGRHVTAARKLLQGGEAQATYACLELRMAIEALTYDMLQRYQNEVPLAAMEKWQPKRVLEELLKVDSNVDQSAFITLTRSDGKVITLGDDRRFSAAWANKAHNSLGNFLHTPTIAQGILPADELATAAARKATDVLAELDLILESPIRHFRAHRLVKTECRCGFIIARDASVLEAGVEVSCGQCGAQYDYAIEDGRVKFILQGGAFACPYCNQRHSALLHELKPGLSLSCTKCSKTIRFKAGVVIDTSDLHQALD